MSLLRFYPGVIRKKKRKLKMTMKKRNRSMKTKLGLKNIFNDEYKLYQPKETYEYIFSKYK
jgi:hypothetical protein